MTGVFAPGLINDAAGSRIFPFILLRGGAVSEACSVWLFGGLFSRAAEGMRKDVACSAGGFGFRLEIFSRTVETGYFEFKTGA